MLVHLAIVFALMPALSATAAASTAERVDWANHAERASHADHAPEESGGRLLRFVLSGARDGQDPPAAKSLAPDVRARVEEFRARTKRVRSRLTPPPGGPDPDGKDGFLSRQDTERALVALFDTPDVARQAAAYAKNQPVSWEYEGYPDGALREAAYTEAYLRRHPETPFAPYLSLYLAARYRIAYETQEEQKDPAGQRVSARKYRAAIARARAASDPLIRAAAEDLDRQTTVYMPTRVHPRAFK